MMVEQVWKCLRKQWRRLQRCGFRRTGKVMGQVYQCWWRICREMIFFPGSNIICFMFYIYCGLFTDSPSRLPLWTHRLVDQTRLPVLLISITYRQGNICGFGICVRKPFLAKRQFIISEQKNRPWYR
jgi:hypothetical protein